MKALAIYLLGFGCAAAIATEFGDYVATGVACQEAVTAVELAKLEGNYSGDRLLSHAERRDRVRECVAADGDGFFY